MKKAQCPYCKSNNTWVDYCLKDCGPQEGYSWEWVEFPSVCDDCKEAFITKYKLIKPRFERY